MDKRADRRGLEQIETLIAAIESNAEPHVQEQVRELIRLFMDYHEKGLARLLALAAESEPERQAMLHRFAESDLVGSLLSLYHLHPLTVRSRVEKALETLRPILAQHNGDILFVAERNGVVQVRLLGGCKGCPSSAVTLRETVERFILAEVPEVIRVESEDFVTPQAEPGVLKEYTKCPLSPLGGVGEEITPSSLSCEVSQEAELASFSDQEGSHCELCAAPIQDSHRHLYDLLTHSVICSCQGCCILVSGSITPRYRKIPKEVRTLRDFDLSHDQWKLLGVPVKIAFFQKISTTGIIRALYPSPAGVTESTVSSQAWDVVVTRNPVVQKIEPDIEALLVDQTKTPARYFCVPIDECFRLVGLFRTHWKGFSGGAKVWQEVERFFIKLSDRGAKKV